MRVTYLIAVHHRPDLFRELLVSLPGANFVVHVDAKVDQQPFEHASRGIPVKYVTDRVNVIWGGWSQVEASLSMLRAAVSSIDDEDYVILLSGDTYPLKSNDAINRYLEERRPGIFVNLVAMPNMEAGKPLSRISRRYHPFDYRNGSRNLLPRVLNRLSLHRNYRKAFGELRPYAGSTWWAVTGEVAVWLLQQHEVRSDFAKFCMRTKMPDEMYFHTLIGNSQFKANVRHSLMFADWSRTVGPKPAFIDVDHVKQLIGDDCRVTDVYGEGTVLFARKLGLHQGLAELIRSSLWDIPLNHVHHRGDYDA